jgi:hypothetical protein
MNRWRIQNKKRPNKCGPLNSEARTFLAMVMASVNTRTRPASENTLGLYMPSSPYKPQPPARHTHNRTRTRALAASTEK